VHPTTEGHLYVTVALSDELLVHGGRPVWPARDRIELSQILELCKVLGINGIEIEESNAQSISAPTIDGRGWVVGLGGESKCGRLYAHLTGRKFRDAADFDALLDGPSAEVVVLKYRFLTTQLLDGLYGETSERTRPIPGLVVAGDDNTLRRQVLLRAATAFTSGTADLRSVEFHPMGGVKPSATANRIVLSRNATPEEVRSAVSAGSSLLCVATHSDGVDANFGVLTACRMDRPARVKTRRSTLCMETAECYRHRMSVDKFVTSDRRFDPDEIATRNFVFATCHGVLPADGMIDPRVGLLDRLLDNPRIGTIVTTWGVRTFSPVMIEPLLSAIESGVQLGEAIDGFNASKHAQAANTPLCLFGDPRAALPSGEYKQPSSVHSTSPRSRTLSAEDWAELGFLRSYLARAVVHADERLQVTGQQGRHATELYESWASLGADLEDNPSAPGPVMRRAVIDFVVQLGPLIFLDWMGLGGMKERRADQACCNCGLASSVIEVSMVNANAGARRLVTCPRCAIVQDMPRSWDLGLSVDSKGTVSLEGELPLRRWTGKLLLASQDWAASVSLDWPTGSDGALRRSFLVPRASWPAGVVKTTLVLMIGPAIGIAQAPWRRP
jgi:hypothetical protein